MVQRDLVAQKISSARARLKAADEIFLRPREEFLADEKQRDLATFYLFLAIQECIDLAAHWVVDEGWGAPEEAGDSFDLLRDKGVVDAELARSFRAATGLRNRIGRGYGAVRPERTHEEYPQGSAALRRFLAAAAETVGL